MRDLVKLVGLDLAVFHTNSKKYFWFGTLISIVLLLLPFLNGDLATPLAGGITGLSIGLLMMPFVGVDRQGMENLYTMLPVRRTTIVAGHYLFGLMTVGLIDACSMLIIGWLALIPSVIHKLSGGCFVLVLRSCSFKLSYRFHS